MPISPSREAIDFPFFLLPHAMMKVISEVDSSSGNDVSGITMQSPEPTFEDLFYLSKCILWSLKLPNTFEN